MNTALKEFIEKNIHFIEQNRFKELYIIAEIEPDLEVYDLTKLLYDININPLLELDYIPAEFIGGTFYGQPDSIDLSKYTHIKHIENGAFSHNANLEEIILPPNLETIGPSAFIMSGLKKIIIPKSVKAIADTAFFDCKHLSEVVIEGKPSIAINAFAGDHVMRTYTTHSPSVAYNIPKGENVSIKIV